MTKDITAFWWSPRRAPRTLLGELRGNGPAWARLVTTQGRAFTNHGDELSALVLREATGRTVRWVPIEHAETVAIGSILAQYASGRATGWIWGTGLHAPVISDDDARRIAPRVLAVRGPLAAAALSLPEQTTIGDPGLLVRAIRRPTGRRSGAVFIPHFTTYGDATQRTAMATIRAAGIQVVPPTLAPAEMLDVIGRADHVISAGMHGVILAHALRTPATLVTLKQPVPRTPAFKYHDYFGSVGLTPSLAAVRDVVDPVGRNAAHARGRDQLDQVDRVIDELVEGLLAAARPLRAGV